MSAPAPHPFDRLDLAQLRRRRSLKWQAYPSDVLPLWVAEMDTVLAAPVQEALVAALDLGDTGYPWGAGYVEAYADYAAAHWGWRPDVGRTALVADVVTGMAEVLELVLGRDGAVVVLPPVYPPFFALAGRPGRTLVAAPLGPDGRLDLTALERAFAVATTGGRPAAVLLSNPHNPTGTVHTAAELGALAALADRTGVRVVVDEIHAPLTYADAGPRFTPYLSVPGSERGFVVFSASKAWNLAGLKAALVVAGADAAADLARMPELVSHGASGLGVLAHTVALTSGQPWLEEHLAALVTQRDLLAALLAEKLPQVRSAPVAATYLAWWDCRALALGQEPAAFFLEHGRVALGVGPDFGAEGVGHVRVNFATASAVLTEAVERMAAAVAAHG